MAELRKRLSSWWGRVRRCPSRAPLGYLDGLERRHQYRWTPRCSLSRGHAGAHRAGSEVWLDPQPPAGRGSPRQVPNDHRLPSGSRTVKPREP
jgi:hypothetical protein